MSVTNPDLIEALALVNGRHEHTSVNEFDGVQPIVGMNIYDFLAREFPPRDLMLAPRRGWP